MGIISVDFDSLGSQKHRLMEYADHIREMRCKIECVYDQIKIMSLDEIEDELRINISRLQRIEDDIESYAVKLSRIMALYEECEDDITMSIRGLSDSSNIFLSSSPFRILDRSEAFIKSLTMIYSGHTVTNDNWLDDLIYETEGK